MPPARKKTATRAPAKTTPSRPAAPSDAPVIGILAGHEIECLPTSQWRNTAMRAVREGDIDTWAELCLTDDGYDLWEELDPTLGEISAFFDSIQNEMAVADPPANRAQRRHRR